MECCCSDWISRLARNHASQLAAIARREGVTAADALDIVQDAFGTLLGLPGAAALRERPDDDGARVLAAIVRNAARNLRRRHHRARPHVGLYDVELDEALLIADTRPDAVLERRRDAERVTGCMTELGEAHRHVVALRVLEELSGEETAAALGLTPGHVAVSCIAHASSSLRAWNDEDAMIALAATQDDENVTAPQSRRRLRARGRAGRR